MNRRDFVSAALATADIKDKFAAISTEVEPVAPRELGRRMQRDQPAFLRSVALSYRFV